MFLGFANFYKRFIKNFNRIPTPLILMLLIIDKSIGKRCKNTLINASNKYQSIPNNTGGRSIDRNIKDLLSIIKSAKSKKSNFLKNNSFKIKFLTLKAKKDFIHL